MITVAILKPSTSVHHYVQWVVSNDQFANMLIIYLISLTEREDPYSEDLEFDWQLISPIFKIKAVQEEFRVTWSCVIV